MLIAISVQDYLLFRSISIVVLCVDLQHFFQRTDRIRLLCKVKKGQAVTRLLGYYGGYLMRNVDPPGAMIDI